MARGVYENPVGSGIWWIHYYAAGKRHREKVGRKSDAIKIYHTRKADAAAGRKLPELRHSKVLSLCCSASWRPIRSIRIFSSASSLGNPLIFETMSSPMLDAQRSFVARISDSSWRPASA